MSKKILWIAASAPSRRVAHAGGQTFRYYFNKMLDANYDVRLIGFADGISADYLEEELKSVDHRLIYPAADFMGRLRKLANIETKLNPWNRYAGILSNYYAGEIKGYARQYKACGFVPDIIILEWTGIVLLAEDIKKIFPKSRLIASEHDVTYVGYERRYKLYTGLKRSCHLFKYKREKKLELKALGLCDLILPHNFDNISLLLSEGIARERQQWIVPFYKDMSAIKRLNTSENSADSTIDITGNDILFFGAMARPENYLSAIWFIENVMPLLKAINVRFVILGSHPHECLMKYKSDKVLVTGFVDDICPYFEQALCLVAPLVLGAGIKVKVLEAMTSGIPVLTNAIGIEGIPAADGRDYLHCETPREYAEKIKAIYNNEITKINGRSFVKEHFSIEASWDSYKRRIDEL